MPRNGGTKDNKGLNREFFFKKKTHLSLIKKLDRDPDRAGLLPHFRSGTGVTRGLLEVRTTIKQERTEQAAWRMLSSRNKTSLQRPEVRVRCAVLDRRAFRLVCRGLQESTADGGDRGAAREVCGSAQASAFLSALSFRALPSHATNSIRVYIVFFLFLLFLSFFTAPLTTRLCT